MPAEEIIALLITMKQKKTIIHNLTYIFIYINIVKKKDMKHKWYFYFEIKNICAKHLILPETVKKSSTKLNCAIRTRNHFLKFLDGYQSRKVIRH